jgi:trehalose-6-phosphate synthase
MSAKERAERADALRAHVREHDLHEWIESQLADLDAVVAPTRLRG